MQKEVEEMLKSEYASYLAMTPEQRKLEDERIRHAWMNVYGDYMTFCEQDEELAKLYDELKAIEKIINFDIREHFTVYSHTENEFDPEMAEDIYVYSPAKFHEAKILSENWDAEEKRLKDKIEEVKKAKFVPFREKKIAKLEKELELKGEIVKYYRVCMEKQEKKDYYLDNEKKLITPLKDRYYAIINKYAKKAIEKNIKTNPNIICVKHTSTISSSARKRGFDTKVLNDVANKISNEVRESLVKSPKR